MVGWPHVATSIRLEVGLQTFQFEIDSGIHVGAGALLGSGDALRLIQRQLAKHELRALIPLATAVARRSLQWDEDLRDLLSQLIASGRVRVRNITAVAHRTLGDRKEVEAKPEAVENLIAETHSVMIELLDAEGNPVPGEPYRIKLPDGTIVRGTLDAKGKAHHTGIQQGGTCQVCFYERDAAIWAPA
jgi:hypothetical protein